MEARSNSSVSVSDVLIKNLPLSMVTSAFTCVFVIINGTILFVLHSKPMFSRCPRYVLLFNLVLADTVLIAQAQVLYIMAKYAVLISYPLCISLAMLSRLITQVSPLTLSLMSLERCVSVCLPFRHCTLVTLRNTFIAILLTWTYASANVLVQLVLLVRFVFYEQQEDPQRKVVCQLTKLPSGPTFAAYQMIQSFAVFILSALVILCSFVAVTVVACLASGDKGQMKKALYTLVLHLFQLGLNLVSMMSLDIFVAVVRTSGGLKVLYVVYVSVVLLPRCLSALTYGLRDPALRPALETHLCCILRLRVGLVEVGRVQVGRVQVQVQKGESKTSQTRHL